MRSTDIKVKSDKWKSRVEVMCESRSKSGSVYKKRRLKSIKLSKAWSFYLSSSSSLSGVIRPSGLLCTSTSNIYLNLSLNSQQPTGLVTCIILIHSYHPDKPYNSRRAFVEVSASDQIRSRSTYSLGLETIGLLPKLLSFSSFWLSWRRSWCSHKREVLSCVQ